MRRISTSHMHQMNNSATFQIRCVYLYEPLHQILFLFHTKNGGHVDVIILFTLKLGSEARRLLGCQYEESCKQNKYLLR